MNYRVFGLVGHNRKIYRLKERVYITRSFFEEE